MNEEGNFSRHSQPKNKCLDWKIAWNWSFLIGGVCFADPVFSGLPIPFQGPLGWMDGVGCSPAPHHTTAGGIFICNFLNQSHTFQVRSKSKRKLARSHSNQYNKTKPNPSEIFRMSTNVNTHLKEMWLTAEIAQNVVILLLLLLSVMEPAVLWVTPESTLIPATQSISWFSSRTQLRTCPLFAGRLQSPHVPQRGGHGG